MAIGKAHKGVGWRGIMRVAIYVVVLLGCGALSGVWVSPGWAAELDGELVAVPEPRLEALEEQVRLQLSEQRRLLDEMLADDDVSPVERATAFGELGRLYHFYDLPSAALACFANAEKLDPADARWPYYLGTLQDSAGLFAEALVSYQRSIALVGDQLAALVRLGDLSFRLRRMDEAASWYRRALEVRPQAPAALFGLGQIAASERDFKRAVDLFEVALVGQPEASAIYYPLGLAYRELGELDKAKAALAKAGSERVSFSDPLVRSLAQLAKGARVHQILGDRARRRGLVEVAIDQYRRSLEIDPENGLVHYNLGTLLSQRGARDEAMAEYREAIRHDPQLKNAHFNLAIGLRDGGDFAGAVESLRAALAIDSADDEARLELALTQVALGDDEAAAVELQTLRERRPQDPRVVLYQSRLWVKKGEGARAEEALQGVLSSPQATARARAEACLILADLELDRGSEEKVRQHLERAVQLVPELVPAQLKLADSLGRSGDYAAAAERYAATLAASPDNELAHQGRAMALILDRQAATAVAALREGLERLPHSMNLANILARLLATTDDPTVRDGERALGIAQSLFEAARGPLFGETVAMAMAAAGRFDDAVPWQERLLAEAEKGGMPEAFLSRLRVNLQRYEAGQVAVPPW